MIEGLAAIVSNRRGRTQSPGRPPRSGRPGVIHRRDGLPPPISLPAKWVRQVPDQILGDVTIPGFPFKYSAFPDELDLQAPLLGQHNAEILSQYLGRSSDTITTLHDQGVLYQGER